MLCAFLIHLVNSFHWNTNLQLHFKVSEGRCRISMCATRRVWPEPNLPNPKGHAGNGGHATLNNWENHLSGILCLMGCVNVPLTVLDQKLRAEPWFSLAPKKDNVGAFAVSNIRKAQWDPKSKTQRNESSIYKRHWQEGGGRVLLDIRSVEKSGAFPWKVSNKSRPWMVLSSFIDHSSLDRRWGFSRCVSLMEEAKKPSNDRRTDQVLRQGLTPYMEIWFYLGLAGKISIRWGYTSSKAAKWLNTLRCVW